MLLRMNTAIPFRGVESPRRGQILVRPQHNPLIANFLSKRSALAHQRTRNTQTPRARLDEQQAQLRSVSAQSIADEHDAADRVAVLLCDPAALGSRVVLFDEFCGDAGDEAFEALVPAVFLVIEDAVAVDYPSDVAGSVGAEGEVAAGPVGRTSSAETDALMHAEILSWSRSRGVFAGVALKGATLRQDLDDNAALYGKKLENRQIVTTGVTPPPAADKLLSELRRYSLRASR